MNTILTLYRKIGDRRVPVVIEYDEEMTIIDSKPGIGGMAKSLMKAAVSEARAVAKGEPPASPEVVAERLAVCEGCERFVAESQRCLDCGCFVQFKTRLRSQHCPQGKW